MPSGLTRSKSRILFGKGMEILNRQLDLIETLMEGAYDLHMHAAPSPFDRALDDYELLEQAGRAGMAGIMLKSHYEPTAVRAELVNRHSASAARAYGGLVLNWPVGGLNPYAVKNALVRNCRIVWMPTRDAANSLLSGNMPGDFLGRKGISILDESSSLKPEVVHILDLAKAHGACVATGHISPEESVMLCREGTARKTRMVLTHPEFSRTKIDAGHQRELADLGVYIEKCWYNIAEGNCTASEMAEHIRTVGADRCFLSTDRGQGNREAPAEGMRLFLRALLEQGLSPQELYTMTHTVPAKVLGLKECAE